MAREGTVPEDRAPGSEDRADVSSSPGIPSERAAGEPETGDSFTATSEGGSTGGPGFGSVVTPPGEGGIPTGPTGARDERDEEGLA